MDLFRRRVEGVTDIIGVAIPTDDMAGIRDTRHHAKCRARVVDSDELMFSRQASPSMNRVVGTEVVSNNLPMVVNTGYVSHCCIGVFDIDIATICQDEAMILA